MTVRGMLNSLDSKEISEWQIFFRLQRDAQGGEAEPADLSQKMMATFGGTTGMNIKKKSKK